MVTVFGSHLYHQQALTISCITIKTNSFQAQQELVRSREEIQDLKEKLETIKIKRAKDQEKIKEFEKVRWVYSTVVDIEWCLLKILN